MPEFFANWSPQAYGIWVGVTAFFGWMGKQWLDTRKLSYEDRQAVRDGFAAQVTSLQTENRQLRMELGGMRGMLAERDQQHDDYRRLCRAEQDQLRGEQDQLRAELEVVVTELHGIKRKYDHLRGVIERQVGLPNRNG